MKNAYSNIKSVVRILLILLVLWQGNAFANTIDEAINHYMNADIEKAKHVFEKLAKQENTIKNRQIALGYLALIEMASRNQSGADDHLFRLLLMDPFFELKHIEDVTPALEKRFNKLKSKDVIKAIVHYQNAELEKAKNIFEKLADQKDKRKDRQIALAYLALIETASRNQSGADEYLSRLLSLNASFDLSCIGDMTPAIKKRFEQIKSGEPVQSAKKTTKEETQPAKDTSRPFGEISGIKAAYSVGETISCTVTGKDDKALGKIIFKVEEKPSVTKRWDVSGDSVSYTLLFQQKAVNPEHITILFF